jgi:Xaa-Pro aminopeptidase
MRHMRERRVPDLLRVRPRALLGALLCALLLPGSVLAGPLQEDLSARRARLMEKLGPDALAIFWSAPVQVYSWTVNYPYRQDSNLLYLTGIEQEDTILVLMPGNERQQAILFIQARDPRREHWEGHSLTPGEATARSGIDRVMMRSQFEPFLASLLSRRSADAEYARFVEALGANGGRVALMLERQTDLTAPLGTVNAFAARMRERFSGFTVVDATPLVHELRQTKTPYEQEMLRKSVAISNEGHLAGMRTAAPGKFEYEVQAAIEAVFMRSGASGWGYPSIVGSGPNATILHYRASRRRMETGELLLVDAAARYEGYTGDVTRTYPVSGTFTPEQREIYEIVLAAQEAGIRAVQAGTAMADVQTACEEVIRAGLFRLGLLTEPEGQQFKIWSTHGFLHFIGLDVHDVHTTRRLEPGAAFVIEPGIYIRETALDDLPHTPENAAFIAKVRPVVQRYRDIGIRIEDSFVLTAGGLEQLSASVPSRIEDIERLMRERRR